MLRKSFGGAQEHIEPAKTDLDLIRKLALRDVKPEEIWAGRMHLANDRVDRSHERFPKEYLDRFAETLPGKSLMGGHNYDTLPLGRFYKASVQKDADGYYLDANYYLTADSPLIPSIELGVIRESSIGYEAGKRVCDIDGKTWSWFAEGDDYCSHLPGQEVDGKTCTLTYCPTEVHRAEAMEGSWVWKGCQEGAMSLPKSAGPGVHDYEQLMWMMAQRFQHGPQGAKRMPTIEEVQAELQQTKAAHQTEAAKWQQEQAELKKQAADGDWGRAYLASEIVRMSGVLGEGDYYATMLKMLGDQPTVAQLEPLWQMVGKKFDEKFPQVRAHTGGAPGPEDQPRPTGHGPWYRPLRRTASGGV